MPRMFRMFLVAALLIPVASHAQSTTIGSSRYWDVWPFGIDTVTGRQLGYGETFKTPDATATHLDSWAFGISNFFDSTATFQFQISEWNGTGLVGAPVFTSADLKSRRPLYPANPPPDTFYHAMTFDVDLDLDPTKMYIAFVNPVSEVQELRSFLYYTCSGCYGSGRPYPGVDSPLYPDGQLFRLQSSLSSDGVYRDLADDPDVELVKHGSGDPRIGIDAEFQATFSPPVVATPEPSSLVLMASGLSLFGIFKLRRRGRR